MTARLRKTEEQDIIIRPDFMLEGEARDVLKLAKFREWSSCLKYVRRLYEQAKNKCVDPGKDSVEIWQGKARAYKTVLGITEKAEKKREMTDSED